MIFYFTGTGNSLQVAENIAGRTGERLISIARVMFDRDGGFEFTLKEDEIIGFIYPVYAWAPPRMVLQFIEKLKICNYHGQYVFSVATCGDNIGNTMEVLKKSLHKRNLPLDSGFSVRMPNNYIILFDVDSKELERKKLLEAEKTLERINAVISERRRDVFETVKGSLPGLLTGVFNPLFNIKAIDTRKFYADEKCTGCGLCERICNCRNITVRGKPQWGNRCTQCLACLHYCPAKAVQYGRGTKRKGRYVNPFVKVEEKP